MAVTDVYPIEQKGDKGILNSFSLQMMFFLPDSFLDMLDVVVQNSAFIIIQMQDRIDIQFQTAVRVYNEKMSVRDVEKLVKNQDRKAPEKKQEDPQQQAVFHDLEERMKLALGTKVSINRKDQKKGKIEIEYYSMEDLERLMDILMK